MSSVNKVILVGHMGKDPETRYSADGSAVTTISVATTKTWKDKAGAKQERTEWSRVVSFGKLAEIVAEHTKKGSLLYVEGSLSTRKWQAKDGGDRYTTEIVADVVRFLGGPRGESAREPATTAAAPAKGIPGGFDEMESDIPF